MRSSQSKECARCVLTNPKGCAFIQSTKGNRGSALASQEGCTSQIFNKGVNSKKSEGCALKISRGVCIQNMRRGVHSNCREGCAFYHFINAHPYPCNAHPSRYPWNSGPIQWERQSPTPPRAPTVHVSHLFIGSSSGMDGIRYLRVFDYVSVS